MPPHDLAPTEPSVPRAHGGANQVGEVLADRFELIAHLGSGGMGSVYRAHDRRLDDEVAIKVLHPDLASSPASLELLGSEVKLARRVTSPNVARIHELVEAGDRWFLTMEFVDGVSLADMIAGGRLPVARIVELLEAICDGLSAVHAAGVVHGDVKPANILVARDGRVVLTDFGIARFAGTSGDTREVVGTPAYMAPEQVTGAALDHRTDLYALGVVAYEMLSGALPFSGRNAIEVATARLIKDPPALGGELPAALGDAVNRAMARDRDDRPETALALREALTAAPREQPREIESVDVVELYLQAQWLYRQFRRAEESVALFAEARASAPDSALIQAGYAMALTRKWMLVGRDLEGIADEATRAVDRAMSLAPHLGEVHAARGAVALHLGDPVTAARAMRRAITRAPGMADPHMLIFSMLIEVDHLDAALRHYDVAVRLDPLMSDGLRPMVARARALHGDWSEAEALMRANIEPGSVAMMAAGRLAAYRGDLDTLERLGELARGFGQPDQAVQVFDALPEVFAGTAPRQRLYDLLETELSGFSRRRAAVVNQMRAEIGGAFGDVDIAIEALEVSDQAGLIDILWLDRCPLLDGLRETPRFAAVRASVRARADAVIDALLG